MQGEFRKLRSNKVGYAAALLRPAGAYREPGGRELASFERHNANGVVHVFGVLGAVLGRHCDRRWYRVQLPLRPNGIVGYVRAGDVAVSVVRTRILVDLAERRVTLYRDGRKVLDAAAGVGSPGTPTPTVRFYVNQRLVPASPHGPFGPGAIGISAFSEVLTGWVQGGPIAIHGTNRPWSIGRDVSNGCIRVANDVIRRIFHVAREGTPVVIRR